MNISINQITPRRSNGEIVSIHVHFSARTADGSINLNGNIPVEEFTGLIDFGGLEATVRQELINRIINGGTKEDEVINGNMNIDMNIKAE